MTWSALPSPLVSSNDQQLVADLARSGCVPGNCARRPPRAGLGVPGHLHRVDEIRKLLLVANRFTCIPECTVILAIASSPPGRHGVSSGFGPGLFDSTRVTGGRFESSTLQIAAPATAQTRRSRLAVNTSRWRHLLLHHPVVRNKGGRLPVADEPSLARMIRQRRPTADTRCSHPSSGSADATASSWR